MKKYRQQIVGLFLVIAGLAIYYREQMHVLSSGKYLEDRSGLDPYCSCILGGLFHPTEGSGLKYPPMQMNLVIFGLPALLYFRL